MIDVAYKCKWESGMLARAGLALLLTATMSLGIGCSTSDTDTPRESAAKTETQPSTNQVKAESPQWVEASRSWPDTLRYTFDSTLEVTQDGLLLRLRTSLALDVSHNAFEDEQPLRCDVLMTVRPVPEWPLAQGLVLDSVALHDPVKNRDLRAIPMLSYQRSFDEQTVRTQFLANMADTFRQSPDLAEGQELVPTIYLSWDGRIIIASMPPVEVTYLKE